MPHTFFILCPLLFQAIIESQNKQLTVSDIYAWFQSTFGHFRQHNATWKVTRNTPNNSLTKTRNLCLQRCNNDRTLKLSCEVQWQWDSHILAALFQSLILFPFARVFLAALSTDKTVLVSYPTVRMSVVDSTMLMLNCSRQPFFEAPLVQGDPFRAATLFCWLWFGSSTITILPDLQLPKCRQQWLCCRVNKLALSQGLHVETKLRTLSHLRASLKPKNQSMSLSISLPIFSIVL